MITDKENNQIIEPKNQLQLFGYKKYFDNFSELYNKKKLPNTILLSGLKGSGKATFAYHFINYLLSLNEDNKYSKSNFTINSINKSYKNLCNNTHPNFNLVENSLNDETIKIDSVKSILSFLNKSTYNSNIKVVLIDNAEYLNISSSNALLKSLEEAKNNTFFFLIHNNSNRILDTIKSRCIEYKIFFNLAEKKDILLNIVKQHDVNLNLDNVKDNLYLEGPGNIFKYLMLMNDVYPQFSNKKLSCIFFLIDKYKKKKILKY
jgi:DNA polymerase III subunit delta'